jgi:hypothetical protein
MNASSFDHILCLITPFLTKQDTPMREAIKPGLKLAVTLHHLAEGSSHSNISAHYRLGRSTVSAIIYDTCNALYKALQPIYLAVPQGKETWKSVSEGYHPYFNCTPSHSLFFYSKIIIIEIIIII